MTHMFITIYLWKADNPSKDNQFVITRTLCEFPNGLVQPGSISKEKKQMHCIELLKSMYGNVNITLIFFKMYKKCGGRAWIDTKHGQSMRILQEKQPQKHSFDLGDARQLYSFGWDSKKRSTTSKLASKADLDPWSKKHFRTSWHLVQQEEGQTRRTIS